MKQFAGVVLGSLLGMQIAHAADISATVFSTQDANNAIGEVVFTETPFGVLINPKLTKLPAGLHGFHLHQHPNCADHGKDAGGHFDPAKTDSHKGPYAQGHLGDLPVLYVNADGTANTPTLAPRLKLSDLEGLTVMVHEGGDNYSDNPTLGGGGARIACGVIK